MPRVGIAWAHTGKTVVAPGIYDHSGSSRGEPAAKHCVCLETRRNLFRSTTFVVHLHRPARSAAGFPRCAAAERPSGQRAGLGSEIFNLRAPQVYPANGIGRFWRAVQVRGQLFTHRPAMSDQKATHLPSSRVRAIPPLPGVGPGKPWEAAPGGGRPLVLVLPLVHHHRHYRLTRGPWIPLAPGHRAATASAH